jgi:hypothetical protein
MVPGGGGRGGKNGRRGGLRAGGNTRYGIVLFSNARNPILECSILLTYRTA